ncbi:MAG TPA: hypothetical protein PKZ26_02175 [Anaerolineaceae bacterium]|jgi:hypothetical protein|nr:hypothetical protein [Chloroflexota bacterium]HNS07272.1 hypothetical protein [Anaerolineaceae bacterium]HOQ69719.1 hypothetical protein [Anaerolineaceae bacterium]HPD62857.1 hypothetical protein [Anaerolineaceae bacterium]HQF68582.1 hypothetical protein [Anaerolineaceae bacterium]
MNAQLTQINPLTLIHRNRLLPVPGSVNVREGQRVAPEDIVAEASIPARHYLVDVVRALSAKTLSAAEKMITRKPGEVLQKNDIIAETGGLFSRVIRTPGEGRVVSVNKGRVLIEAESTRIKMQAGLAGKVTQVIPERGATIQCYGALIQGVWGNALLGCGPLTTDYESLSGELKTSAIGVTSRGAVLAGGTCSEAFLAAAAQEKIGGLILGSISSSLISTALELPYALIILSGFGDHGMDELSRSLLATYIGRDVSINAVKWNRLTGDRPEVYIPLEGEAHAYEEQAMYTSGQTVRLQTGAYAGRIGRIESLLPGVTLLPSGLRAAAARVVFGENLREIIPLSNLDVIFSNDRFIGAPDEGGVLWH